MMFGGSNPSWGARMAFVHLHRHSEYSRLDGLGNAQQYADRAVDLNQGALGQADHGTLSGALHHIEACRKAGIFPVSGVEAYFRPNRAIAKQFKQREAYHLCLFAKNLRGWHNLLRIVSTAYGEPEEGGGFYQYPCVDFELLERYSEGLACTSACVSSWLSKLIEQGDSMTVSDYIVRMKRIFGDDFWLEIMPHDFDQQRELNVEIVGLAMEHSIPLIATNDAHFPYPEWADTHRIAKILGSGSCFSKVEKDIAQGKADYLAELNPTLYICSEQEMYDWFQRFHPQISKTHVDESIQNTQEFVSRINPFMLDKTDKLPKVTEDKDEAEKILRDWIEQGLERIFAEYPQSHWETWSKQSYRDRIETEWAVLKSKGVIDYFVMVGDVVRWAKANEIRVGLGRGSAAGCLISYLVGIVAIDPISWGLLFERFLNPERKGLPDIDLDFDSDKRHLVKQYIADRYGQDHVADIITHSTFQPKKVIQDLCRVYDDTISFTEGKAVTDTIEIRQDDEETTLEELLPLNDKLREFSHKYPDIWKHALRLEGQIANAGKHAAGIIITPKPVIEFMALERGKSGDLVTSWSDAADFPAVSDHGLVKLDALGITGLAKHEYACKLIEKRTGEKVDLYGLGPLRNPYNADPRVLQLFADGHTVGVFQFGGRGITGLLREIQPDVTLDLAAANALYRPGPMKGGVTWDYAKRKQDPSLITFWHDLVAPILEQTYGLIAYQEQVMEIAKELGGFSGAEADDLRKAMGKLYRIKGGRAAKDFMTRFESKWFAGCTERGIGKALAKEIWGKILEFGHYGFNKSHSASYALQAYQDAHLKVYYPAEFYAAFLTYEDDEDKKKVALREAKALGIEIVLPDVNRSDVGYTVDDDGALLLGLQSIKGVGERSASQLIGMRPFADMEDYIRRGSREADTRALLEAGALDCLAPVGLEGEKFRTNMLSVVRKVGSKAEAYWEVWEHLKHNTKLKTARPVPDEQNVPSVEDMHRRQSLALNMPLSSLAMGDDVRQMLEENVWLPDEVDNVPNKTQVIVGGEVAKVVKKKTKKGKDFANVQIVFEQHEWQVKFWQEQLEQFEYLLSEGQVIMVAGKKDEWNGFVTVTAFRATSLDALMKQSEEQKNGQE